MYAVAIASALPGVVSRSCLFALRGTTCFRTVDSFQPHFCAMALYDISLLLRSSIHAAMMLGEGGDVRDTVILALFYWSNGGGFSYVHVLTVTCLHARSRARASEHRP